MITKVKESWVSLILFLIVLAAFIILYISVLRPELIERVYPTKESEGEWILALNMFYYIAISLVVIIHAIWYAEIWRTTLDAFRMRKHWYIYFIAFIAIGICLPIIFTTLHPIDSEKIKIYSYIFSYFIGLNVITFIISTFRNYPEIKYCAGTNKILGH